MGDGGASPIKELRTTLIKFFSYMAASHVESSGGMGTRILLDERPGGKTTQYVDLPDKETVMEASAACG